MISAPLDTAPRIPPHRRLLTVGVATLIIGLVAACEPSAPTGVTLGANAPSFARVKGPIRDDGMETVGNETKQDFITSSVPGVQWPLQYVSPACTFNPFVDGALTDLGPCWVQSWDLVSGYGSAGGMLKASPSGFLTTQDHNEQLDPSGGSPPLGETDWTQNLRKVRRSAMSRSYFLHTAGTWKLAIPYKFYAAADADPTASLSFKLLDSAGVVISSQTRTVSGLGACASLDIKLPRSVVDPSIPSFFPADQEWSDVTKTTFAYTNCLLQQKAAFNIDGAARLGTWVTLQVLLDEMGTTGEKPVWARLLPTLDYPARKIDIKPASISLSSTQVVNVYLYSDAVFDASSLIADFSSPGRGVDLGSVLLFIGQDVTGQPVGARIKLDGSDFEVQVADYDSDGRLDLRMDFSVAELQAAGLAAGGSFQLGGLYIDLYDRDGSSYDIEFEGRDPSAPTVVN